MDKYMDAINYHCHVYVYMIRNWLCFYRILGEQQQWTESYIYLIY